MARYKSLEQIEEEKKALKEQEQRARQREKIKLDKQYNKLGRIVFKAYQKASPNVSIEQVIKEFTIKDEPKPKTKEKEKQILKDFSDLEALDSLIK